MRKFLSKTIAASLVFLLILTTSWSTTADALSLPYKWANKYNTVTFYCGFNSTWTGQITEAMTTWNNVKELITNKNLVPLVLNTTTFSLSNKIYSTTGQTWLAAMYPTQSGGTLTSASIAFNLDYNFTSSGAVSGQYDIQSVAVHELGHAIGVAHCHEIGAASCLSSTCSNNVMRPTLSENLSRRTLQVYDSTSKQTTYSP